MKLDNIFNFVFLILYISTSLDMGLAESIYANTTI